MTHPVDPFLVFTVRRFDAFLQFFHLSVPEMISIVECTAFSTRVISSWLVSHVNYFLVPKIKYTISYRF